MAEKIIHPESHRPSHEHAGEHKEHHERVRAHHEKAAEHARREQSELNLAKLREQAKSHAETATRQTVEKHADKTPSAPLGTQHALKADAYMQTLSRIQKRLNPRERTFSKVIHNKTVDTISNVGAVTVARPSGILGGSICAFIGSLVLYFMSRHYGFRYNYLMLFLLFVVGFAVGGLIELLVWALHTRKKHYRNSF